MNKIIPKITYKNILNSLSGGTVPREGLGYIAVGRERELDSLLHDIDIIKNGGSTFRFIVGDYGSGKTFLLQTIKEYAVKRNFVVAEVDLTPERSLIGNSHKKRGLATYKELMINLSNKTNQTGKSLSKILDTWTSKIFEQAALKSMSQNTNGNIEHIAFNIVFEHVEVINNMTNGFTFAKVLVEYWKAGRLSDFEKKREIKQNCLRWFMGDFQNIRDVKKALNVESIINDENWFDIIKIWAVFFKINGYDGFLILIDELINIYNSINRSTRQLNYEKILSMYNDALQGKIEHLGIIMSGVPNCIYNQEKGLYSYEALRSRLSANSYQKFGYLNMMTPIINISPLSKEEIYVLLEKISEIHQSVYGYHHSVNSDELVRFIKVAFMKREEYMNITPRTMIRDFVQLLNIRQQNVNYTITQLIDDYKFIEDEGYEYL